MPDNGLYCGKDGVVRCKWCGDDPFYQAYHDTEWGFPVADDIQLFEKMSLEGFQAGLSWITILRKRENFRAGFDGFNFRVIADYTSADVERFLGDAGIVRHRGKIEAVINNAQRVLPVIEEFGSFATYLWCFEPKVDERPASADYQDLRVVTQVRSSVALSKDLKKRGFKFVGPTTMYALMQAMGMVNDHFSGCYMREKIESARQTFRR